MRAYFFTNMYLSPIQKGIQTAHATTELFVKYDRRTSLGEALYEWAGFHKTMIVVDGGAQGDMRQTYDTIINTVGHIHPHSSFFEDTYSLNGAFTAFAIVLPAQIYDTATALREEPPATQSEYYEIMKAAGIAPEEFKLVDIIKRAPLAR